MKKLPYWIGSYWALIIGVALPIALVTSIWFYETLPKLKIPPPKYDLLYVVTQYPHEALTFDVTEEGKLRVLAAHHTKNQPFQMPKLFRFDVKTKTSHEIKLPPLPPMPYVNAKTVITQKEELIVEGTEKLALDIDSESPDGYKVQINKNITPGSLINLFYERNNKNGFCIKKDVKKIDIAVPASFRDIQFLGWITSDVATNEQKK